MDRGKVKETESNREELKEKEIRVTRRKLGEFSTRRFSCRNEPRDDEISRSVRRIDKSARLDPSRILRLPRSDYIRQPIAFVTVWTSRVRRRTEREETLEKARVSRRK